MLGKLLPQSYQFTWSHISITEYLSVNKMLFSNIQSNIRIKPNTIYYISCSDSNLLASPTKPQISNIIATTIAFLLSFHHWNFSYLSIHSPYRSIDLTSSNSILIIDFCIPIVLSENTLQSQCETKDYVHIKPYIFTY